MVKTRDGVPGAAATWDIQGSGLALGVFISFIPIILHLLEIYGKFCFQHLSKDSLKHVQYF